MRKELKTIIGTISLSLLLSTNLFAQELGDRFKDNEREPARPTSTSNRGSGREIVATEPTHFFFNPRVHVNDRNHIVIALNEISFGLGANTQIQGSPWHHIGRVKLGIKHQLNDNMSIGVGLGRGSTMAFFTALGVGVQRYAEFVLVPSGYLTFSDRDGGDGDHHNLGVGMGGSIRMNELFSLIVEAGIWNDFYSNHNEGFLGLSGGLRIIPPAFPFLYFDGGVHGSKMIYGGDDNVLSDGDLNVYIDIGICFVL